MMDDLHRDLTQHTLPRTNIAPENGPYPKRNVVSQLSVFRNELLVSGSGFLTVAAALLCTLEMVDVHAYFDPVKKCLPESSKGLKFEPLNHQKQTWGLKFDTLGGSRCLEL